MRNALRWTRAHRAWLLGAALTGGILISLTAATRAPRSGQADETATRQPILVTSREDGYSTNPDATTLQGALLRAANDPADNVIRFDPAAFARAESVVQLADPIVVDSARAGHDCIDGSAIPGGLTIRVDRTTDAVVSLANDASLTITHLTIRGGNQRTILVKDAAHLHLAHAEVTGSPGPGVAVFADATVRIEQSRLLDSQTHGLELHDRAEAALEKVEASANRQSGFAAFDAARIVAADCRLAGNGDWNLVLTQRSQAELTGCRLETAQFANGDVADRASLTLEDCIVERSGRFGLFVTGDAKVTLTGTRLSRNAGRGIELQDQAHVTLDRSHIEGNHDYGLILFGDSSVRARETAIARNAAHGASLRENASGQFEGCTFTGNRYSGIGCLDDQQGGRVLVTRCTFLHNGMRPIYRGPMHLDPLVPTPVKIHGSRVLCLADPRATIELFLDRTGEAARYLKTVQADGQGRFVIDCREIPENWVMTAAATVEGATSEFNVVGGTVAHSLLSAILARTGPLSDTAHRTEPEALLRRWPTGTRLVFHMTTAPSESVEGYVRFFVRRVADWTGGAIRAELRVGSLSQIPEGTVVIPIRYVEADSPRLMGRGGVTFMKWDARGHFLTPMEILVALGEDRRETCPRVLAHEIGHTLGLCHVRVGLLSRMQGSVTPGKAFVNDFAPIMTYYDVLALHILHDRQAVAARTLGDLAEAGLLPAVSGTQLVRSIDEDTRSTFSPAAPQPPE